MEESLTISSKSASMYLLVQQCERIGMSVKRFCKKQGLSPATYYYWHKKYHAQHSSRAAITNNFQLLTVQDRSVDQEMIPFGIYAEYKGIRFYQEPSASLLKSLIS